MRDGLIKRGIITGRNQGTFFEELTSALIDSGEPVEMFLLDILSIKAPNILGTIEKEAKRAFLRMSGLIYILC
jgi:hypothetical protein